MASRVEWISAQRTGRTSRFDEADSLNREPPRLFTRARDPRRLAVFFFSRRLLGEDDDSIGARVIGNGERANDEVWLVKLFELLLARQLAGPREVLEHLAEMARNGSNLLLFELQRDDDFALTRLEDEDALADRSDRAEGDPRRLSELIEATQDLCDLDEFPDPGDRRLRVAPRARSRDGTPTSAGFANEFVVRTAGAPSP